MPCDPNPMPYRRDPIALVHFALREGDLRLVELLARALRRDPDVAVGGAPLAAAPAPPRASRPPSALARRTLDALLVLLAIDEPSRRRREGGE